MSIEPLRFVVVVSIWTALALPALVSGLAGRDFFGRVGGQPKGPRLPAMWGWFLMELPAMVTLPAIYLTGARLAGDHPLQSGGWAAGDLLVAAWTAHYAHRTLLWPWLAQREGSPLPAVTCAAGFGFNVVNGLLFGWFLTRLADYPAGWFGDMRFVAGAAAMALGAAVNIWADYHLARLRHAAPGRAVLPASGPYRLVSCPNLMGEMLEWAGFALMCWSLPGLSFAIWTWANLIPRALWRHRWYHQQFENYPRNRRAVIPGLL